MVRALLVRGMLVGLFAGVLAFAFAYIVGEPQVQKAIDLENLLARQSGVPAGAELVSRGVQSTWGLLVGTVLVGVALGGGFSFLWAWAYGRAGIAGARSLAAALALAAFACITLLPSLKYPANPPTVGSPETLDSRSLLGLAAIAIAILALIAALRIRTQLLGRLDLWPASIAAAGVFFLVVAGAYLVLPSAQPTPKAFPADVLYQFRLASLGTNLTMWTAIGLGFGALAERLLTAKAHTVRPLSAETLPA